MGGSRQDVGVALATWAAMYNQRIGQFLSNIMLLDDLFYVEDDELLRLAQEYVTTHPPQVRERP